MSSGVPSRQAALKILEDVLDKDRSVDEAMVGLEGLETRDRGFARLTALTVLRRLGQLDDLIAGLMDRPPQGRTRRILNVLRIGLAQRLFLDTPSHAAVDAAVELARAEGMAKLSGLVNAVLRRADREGSALLTKQDPALLNTPDWLWADWNASFGEEAARSIAAAHLKEPPTDLSVIDSPLEWATTLNATPVLAGSVRLPKSGDITTLPGFAEGRWWVQDAAARLPVKLLGDVSGKTVIDLCAAPGGKTAQMIASGANVIAVDRSKSRLKRLSENLTRLSMNAEVVAADATRWRPKTPADAVLLDAPCSATGTLRRHPEIAYRRGPADVEKLAALQKRLVTAAVDMLAPGGLLVVATCSLQAAEGAELYEFCEAQPGLTPVPPRQDEIPELPARSFQGDYLRTLPCDLSDQGGMDGFFTARFRKGKAA